MPNNPSAAKRLRQNEVRRQRNKARKTELKTIRKKLLRAVHDGEREEADRLYRRLSQRLDQAASKGILHRSAADRHKSRLGRRVHAGSTAEGGG